MSRFKILKGLMLQHRYRLTITYILFSLEMAGSLLRFYFFGEAVNKLIKGSYNGLYILVAVHIAYMVIGTIRHMYDTRTYSAIYNTLVTTFLSKKFGHLQISKLSAHSNLAREFVDFLEHDLVYVIEAGYNLFGSLCFLFFYDKSIVGICLMVLIPVTIISYFYGKKMNTLNLKKNDELEQQVDVITTGDNKIIQNHYNNLRKWQIRISDKEAYNFGFMELMVIIVIICSLVFSKSIHNPTLLAGSLFGIYSYLLKFASGLDTIPYTIQRLSSLNDITKRIELQEEDFARPVRKKKNNFINKNRNKRNNNFIK